MRRPRGLVAAIVLVVYGLLSQEPHRMLAVFGIGMAELLIIAVMLMMVVGVVVGAVALAVFLARKKD